MGILLLLEKHLRWLAIPNLTRLLIFGQIIAYVLVQSEPRLVEQIVLVPELVVQGQAWRLLTFVFQPPGATLFFAALAWYFFYLLGSSLEEYWGDARYTLFLAIGWAATVGFALLSPLLLPDVLIGPISNAFLAGTVFLAFAHLNPDFQILLFFIVPVKIKWMAWATWAWYLYAFVAGSWPARFAIAASVCNYLLFFSRDIGITIRSGHRRMDRSARRFSESRRPVHRCLVCGATEQTNPDFEFRYCSRCSRKACYCMQHLHTHQHQ